MLMTQLFRENLENIGEPKNIRDSTLNGFRWSSVGAGLSRMAASAWSRFGNGLVTAIPSNRVDTRANTFGYRLA
ncbi:unnamed protein product [Diplocarpon coronariae]